VALLLSRFLISRREIHNVRRADNGRYIPWSAPCRSAALSQPSSTGTLVRAPIARLKVQRPGATDENR
jgi:hypothetical protein